MLSLLSAVSDYLFGVAVQSNKQNDPTPDVVVTHSIRSDVREIQDQLEQALGKRSDLAIADALLQDDYYKKAQMSLGNQLDAVEARIVKLSSYQAIEDVNKKKIQGTAFEGALDRVNHNKMVDVASGRFAKIAEMKKPDEPVHIDMSNAKTSSSKPLERDPVLAKLSDVLNAYEVENRGRQVPFAFFKPASDGNEQHDCGEALAPAKH